VVGGVVVVGVAEWQIVVYLGVKGTPGIVGIGMAIIVHVAIGVMGVEVIGEVVVEVIGGQTVTYSDEVFSPGVAEKVTG